MRRLGAATQLRDPRGICGEQSGTGAAFSPSSTFSPTNYHSINAQYSFITTFEE